MALTFGAATSDRVNHGSAASLDSLTTFTLLFWFFPTTLTAGRRLFSKGEFPPFFEVSAGASDEFRIRVNQAISATEYETNNANLTTNKWWFTAADYSSGATPRHHIYLGDLATLATERTYIATDNGSGARASDATEDYLVGNRGVTTTLALQGQIAFHGCWNRVLTLAEIQQQQFRPHPTSGCVLFAEYGYAGTGTQPDYSGNANSGTVTGATVGDHVPIPFRRSGPLWVPYTVAAAGRTTKNTRAWPLGVEIGMNWRGAA